MSALSEFSPSVMPFKYDFPFLLGKPLSTLHFFFVSQRKRMVSFERYDKNEKRGQLTMQNKTKPVFKDLTCIVRLFQYLCNVSSTALYIWLNVASNHRQLLVNLLCARPHTRIIAKTTEDERTHWMITGHTYAWSRSARRRSTSGMVRWLPSWRRSTRG